MTRNTAKLYEAMPGLVTSGLIKMELCSSTLLSQPSDQDASDINSVSYFIV